MSLFKEKEKSGNEFLYDAIIVGSGLAGLQTAYDLIHKHGILPERIIILEAQDYIGGRVKQCDNFVPNTLIELGAEILHGEDTELTKFAKLAGESYYPIYCWAHGDGGPMEEPVDGHFGMYYLSDSKRLLRFDAEDPDFVHLNKVLKLLPAQLLEGIPPDISLKDFLVSNGCNEEMLSLAFAGYANTSCSNLSELSLRQVVKFSQQWDCEGEGDGDFKFHNTFKCLVDFFKENLLHQCSIVCNTPVQEIRRLSDGSKMIEVVTKQGVVYSARTCVVTASIHVLKSPDLLRFNPPLPPGHQEALNGVTMNKAMKIFVRFRAQVWPKGLQGMIMAPPSSCNGDFRNSPFVPETWFVSKPCSLHLQNPFRTDHDPTMCPNCAFYCVGFCTSAFADALNAIPDDDELCLLLARQLDDVFSKVDDKHWLDNHPPVRYSAATLTTLTTSVTDSSEASEESATDSDDDEEDDSDSSDDGHEHDSSYLHRVVTKESLHKLVVENSNGDNTLFQTPALMSPTAAYLGGKVQRWTPEHHPYVGGGYASCLIGGNPNYAEIFGGDGIDDVLFFAGEGVNFPAGGTAHGALESGIHAANLVSATLTAAYER